MRLVKPRPATDNGWLTADISIGLAVGLAALAMAIAWGAGVFERSRSYERAAYALSRVADFSSQASMLGRTCAIEQMVTGIVTPGSCAIPAGARPVPAGGDYFHGPACATDAGDGTLFRIPADPYQDRIECLFEGPAFENFPALPAASVEAAATTPTVLPRRCTTQTTSRGVSAAIEMRYGVWLPANDIEQAGEIENLVRDGLRRAGPGAPRPFYSVNGDGVLVCL